MTATSIETLREAATDGASLVDAVGDDVVEQARVSLRWARETFRDRLVVASSMGDEVLVHLASTAAPGVDVLFLDTGYHFAETLGTRDAVAAVYDVNVRTLLPLPHGRRAGRRSTAPTCSRRDPDRCCAMRKVEPLERGLAPYDAWVTGMRREDAPTRTRHRRRRLGRQARQGEAQPARGVDAGRRRRATSPSTACCSTRCARSATPRSAARPAPDPSPPGEDPRAGRWSGNAKTECGLHT